MTVAGATVVFLMTSSHESASAPPQGLTAVAGLKVGHYTLAERPTGCTVVLAESGVVAGVDVRGSAPGTRETDLLNPVNTVEKVHAILLAGGSAFGLDAASGVMRYLEEHGIGYDVGVAKVPIVPAAILLDLAVGGRPDVRPGADCGYRASAAASSAAIVEGNVGAGAGATVGKLAGAGRAMKSGIGTAAATLPGGVMVAALVAVNALGDVIDPGTGKVVAGVRTEDGSALADARVLVRSGRFEPPRRGAATSLGVVATNARLTKAQATKMAQMAQDGLARVVYPVHSPYDGDTIFALATGAVEKEPDLLSIGSVAADVVSEAVLRAVRAATGIAGYPAARDMHRGER